MLSKISILKREDVTQLFSSEQQARGTGTLAKSVYLAGRFRDKRIEPQPTR